MRSANTAQGEFQGLSSESDLTAKSVVRNVAIRLFAEHGGDAVTIRQIATQAQVSPALVVHHFGSKAGLREAIDAHVCQVMEGLLDQVESADVTDPLVAGDARSFAEEVAGAFPSDSPIPAYLRRLFLSGDSAGMAIFTRWYQISRASLDSMTATGVAVRGHDLDVRAAFLLVNDLAILLMRGPLNHALGFDPLSSEGLVRWTQEATHAYQHGVFTTKDHA